MKPKIKYPHLSFTLAILAFAFVLFALGIFNGPRALCLICMGQLALLACSRQRPALFLTGFTDEQMREFESILHGMRGYDTLFKNLPERLNNLETENKTLRDQVGSLRKTALHRGIGDSGVRWIGNVPFVTDDCANYLTASLVVSLGKLENGLERMVPDRSARERIYGYAKGIVGQEIRAGGAITPTDIPLPTIYAPQIVELVFRYGQARQYATVFPLGAGTVKLPRLQAGEDAFGYLGVGTAGQSQNVPEKEVEAALVTFTANKCGGIIRIPFEIEEDTFIPIGQFLARYIARQFAKLEDSTLFLGDGTGTYANITGVGPYCVANATYLQQLAAGKTKPTDAALSDFRSLRARVNPAVFFGMTATGQSQAAYYMSPTMEALLVTFNTLNQPLIYRPPQAGQPATLDGFPIRWIGVSQGYSTLATPGAYLAFFGDLSYWYLGERGAPRVEVSKEVYFATDEIAMRALERIDVEAMALDAMATLQTAAA